MILKDILGDKEVYIEYRTNSPVNSEQDIYTGACRWDGKELHSIDRDNYSIYDVITKYEIENEKNIIVWYKSTWTW